MKQVRSIKAVDTSVEMSTYKMIPSDYLQAIYPSNNSCVWLSTCISVSLVDTFLADSILHMFRKYQAGFEWPTIFNKIKKMFHFLFDMLRHTPGMDLDLCRVKIFKDCKSSTIIEYILEGKNNIRR